MIMAIAAPVLLLSLRILYVVRSILRTRRRHRPPGATTGANTASTTRASAKRISNNTSCKRRDQTVNTLVVLGSGGHTTEMIRLLQELDPVRYSPITYVVADSDATSLPRLREFIMNSSNKEGTEAKEEEEKIKKGISHNDNNYRHSGRWRGRYPADHAENKNTYYTSEQKQQRNELKMDNSLMHANVHRLPRAREVNQSYITSLFTTLHSFLKTLQLVWKVQPELVLCNGPGTCVPLIYSVFLFRVLGIFRVMPLVWMGQNTAMQQHQHGTRSSSGAYNNSRRHNGDCKVIFVESLCRVQTLSLSGKMVYPLVDQFLVHWPVLKEKYSMVELCDVFVSHNENESKSNKR